MKTARWLLLAFLANSCLSCVTSLLPIFENGYLVSEPGLVGTWKEADGEDTWTFEAAEDQEYRLLQRQAEHERSFGLDEKDEKLPGDTARFRARLGRLGGGLFLDLFPADEGNPMPHNDLLNAHLVPAHTLARIWLGKDSLKLVFLSEEWLSKAIKSGQIKVAHVETEENGLVLTAPTEEIQALVVKYADDPKAFPREPSPAAGESPVELLRVK